MAKAKSNRKAEVEVKSDELRRSFGPCLERVRFNNERVVVLHYGKRVAALVSIADLEKIEAA